MNVIEAKEVTIPAKPSFVAARRSTDKSLATYSALVKEVGVEVPQLIVEDFMAILEKKQYPIYNRAEVVKYMDARAAKDGKGFGWQWKAIRRKDLSLTKKITFGKPSEKRFLDDKGNDRESDVFSVMMIIRRDDAPHRIIPASDYYNGADERAKVYDKAIPMHALQRVAAIERDYAGPVCFLVSDYATEPHIKPDPFLMALLPNVPPEQGCFVIDVWDEPGFGLEQMLK